MKNHLILLDYVRGVAILLVLLFHTLGTTFGFDSLPWHGWFRDFSGQQPFLFFLPLSFGSVGVPIFFVVSGFCIHLSFEQQGREWRGFFIRRFFRIYPPYFFAAVFSCALIIAHGGVDFHNPAAWRAWLTHLFLVHNFDKLNFYTVNGSFWSLAIEAQLYLVYPGLRWLVKRFGWRPTMAGLGACEILIRLVDGNFPGIFTGLLAASPLGYWFSWTIGAFLADAHLKKQPLPFSNSPAMPWLALAVASYFVKPIFPLMFLLFAVTTAIVVSRLLGGSAFKISSLPMVALKKIGLWSYSLYLLHQPLINIYSDFLAAAISRQYRSPSFMFALELLTWPVVFSFGVLWYKLFELPSIALGKYILQKGDAKNASMFESQRTNGIRWIIKPMFWAMMGVFLFLAVGSCWISSKFVPDPPELMNNKAWALATNPDPMKRNGALAVQLAEDACNRTQYRTTTMVGTLGACYAEVGRFDDAIAAAQRAIMLAGQNGETNLLQKNQELLALYLQHQPYREISTNQLPELKTNGNF